MNQGASGSQSGDYQKYMKDYAGDYSKYMSQGGSDKARNVILESVSATVYAESKTQNHSNGKKDGKKSNDFSQYTDMYAKECSMYAPLGHSA
eukprot:3761583-Amphidinium_carterae.1